MYYQSYEDYIRSILGYPVAQDVCTNTYSNNMMTSPNTEFMMQTPMYSDEIMDLYPEIYKILNPMVCKICEANTKPITRELIDAMTDEIYTNIESDPSVVDTINVRVNLPKEEKIENSRDNSTRSRTQVVNPSLSTTSSTGSSNRTKEARPERSARQERASNSLSKQDKIVETSKNITEYNNMQEEREYRQRRRNTTLQDLIRILILNQLLGGHRRPPRPRPRPPRPPFPGRPGQNPRPPFPGGGRTKS